MKTLHWIEDVYHFECPVCGEYVVSPSAYPDCRCPICGFQDEKDKKDKNEEDKKEVHNER